MDKKPPSVTFQEPSPPIRSFDEPVTTRMRYSQLLKSIAGGSMISGQASETSAADQMRRAFDSSALPAKPAMKRSGGHKTLSSVYPVVQEGAVQPIMAGQFLEAATGADSQTRGHGAAALASALGDMEIPRACPPPPPPTSARQAAANLEQQAADAGRLGYNSTMVVNACATQVLPQVIRDSAAHAAACTDRTALQQGSDADDAVLLDQGAGSHHFPAESAAINNTAGAWGGSPASSGDAPHVMVQLGSMLTAPGKMQYNKPGFDEVACDVSTTGQQLSDQGMDADDSWQQDQYHAKDTAAAEAAIVVDDDDDDAGDETDSNGQIIPPGHQEPLPTFSRQLTVRALVTGVIVGFVFVLLTMRLSLVTGIAPNLQVVIAGSCWVLLKTYTRLFGRDMQCIRSLTAQEVAVAASAALAVASSAAAGGFGTVLLAIQDPVAQRVGSSVPANLPSLVWRLNYWSLVCYLLVVGLAGAMLMLAFRRLLLARPSMTFATGAAAGQLINTLHTPPMSYHGHKQMHRFTQWSAISFLFSGYQWVFNNPACNGFSRFPTFGLQALSYTWNFDSQLPFVGLGILAPVSVAWSLVVGGVLTWGLLWPVFTSKEGSWFPKGLAADDIRGTYGYHLVAATALLLADALYHIIKGVIGFVSDRKLANCRRSQQPAAVPGELNDQLNDPEQPAGVDSEPGPGLKRRRTHRRRAAWRHEALRIIETDTLSDASTLQFGMAAMERTLRQHIFITDGANSWAGVAGFVLLMGAAVAALPNLFGFQAGVAVGGASKTAAASATSLMYYHVLVAAILAAVVAVASARGAGVTNINLADAYTKLGILIFSAWAGGGAGSTSAGLLCGGLLCGAATSAVNGMYAWRAGFMVMASPTAIFVSHMIGLGFGCLFAPLAWLLFDSLTPLSGVSADSLFASDGFFASPLAAVFRSTAALAGLGLSALPLHAVWVGLGAVVVAFMLNVLRDMLPVQARGLVPIPAAVGVVCLSGAAVAVDLAIGAVARIVWRLRYPRSADAYALVVGCALIAGEGLWGLGKGLLAAFGQQGPICMSFSLAPAA